MRALTILGAAALALLSGPSHGQDQDEPSRHARSVAAGYKAAFICSATFNGGRSLAEIESDELARAYPDYRSVAADLPAASIDKDAKRVSVAFADDMPPRIAQWRPYLGCAQLPMGAGPDAVTVLPRIDLPGRPADLADRPWPDGDRLPRQEPVLSNQARAALDDAVNAAFDRATYGEGTETTAVMVLKDGQILSELYRDGFDLHTSQRTWSVAKSIAATVIGAAAQQDLLDVKAPAPIPEWSAPGDPRAAITLEQLLHMSSGLYSGARGNRTDYVYFGGSLVTERATANPLEAPPGSRWKYANNDTMLAIRALRAAIDDDQAYLRFPFTALLHKIGMWHTMPETDWQGNFVLSSQVWTTARDLARLGLLYLNDGVWNGERILPGGWTDYVRTPAPSQPPRVFGYGAQFWLYNQTQDIPDDAFAARGHRGQYVVIVPSRQIVIVRRGYDESGGTQFDLTTFTRDVIAALP